MRKLLTILAATVAAAAHGQAPSDLNELQIWNALVKLQADSSYSFTMSGTVTVGSVTRSFNSVLYFNLSTDPRTKLQSLAKMELDDYDTTPKTPVLTRRTVADGANLWVYDFVHQRYYSSFYSFYGNTRPTADGPSDSPKMLEQVQAAVEGPSQYMVRLLREINQGEPADAPPEYDSWAPGEVTMQPLTEPPTQDPLVASRQYSTSSAEQWVLYGPAPLTNPKYYATSPNRSVAFQIDNVSGDANSPDWRLTNVYFAERTRNTFSNWSIAINDPSAVVPTWAFQPYNVSVTQGWQPLNVTRHYTN